MYINISICVALFAGTMFTTWEGAYGTNHSLTWTPANNQNLHIVSDHGSNFLVGDMLVFRKENEKEDYIAQVMSDSEYEACRVVEGSKAVIFKGGDGIELNRSGFWYFISRISDRCKSGEKVMIRVDQGREGVVKNESSRMGRGGGGGGGGGNGGSGSDGGFVTPKGNRDRPDKNAATAAAAAAFVTRAAFIVLLSLYSILFRSIHKILS